MDDAELVGTLWRDAVTHPRCVIPGSEQQDGPKIPDHANGKTKGHVDSYRTSQKRPMALISRNPYKIQGTSPGSHPSRIRTKFIKVCVVTSPKRTAVVSTLKVCAGPHSQQELRAMVPAMTDSSAAPYYPSGPSSILLFKFGHLRSLSRGYALGHPISPTGWDWGTGARASPRPCPPVQKSLAFLHFDGHPGRLPSSDSLSHRRRGPKFSAPMQPIWVIKGNPLHYRRVGFAICGPLFNSQILPSVMRYRERATPGDDAIRSIKSSL
ncbi:hypothetical protein SAMN00768000_0303 [Sulfobacillus thermosulfidooxidans DSM 9293]|uniref:Uncharacterized protein n=1 Tax=Sulfobacillus thermosulfidooxidans (strain DSM 9293 / VKM B-1269 / AT-1) TaxID=929705 RepID=A0A1W1W706_SULTA|nr:hypothetical protein SAMN00768000_0303 [Sulfobacillus thermosulfidooxidans DSM 9293]